MSLIFFMHSKLWLFQIHLDITQWQVDCSFAGHHWSSVGGIGCVMKWQLLVSFRDFDATVC